MDRAQAPQDGGSDERPAAMRWWRTRPLLVSVATLSAIAVLTLAAIVQSSSAKAGGDGGDAAASSAPAASSPSGSGAP